jgi:hypothetical protein
MKQGGLWVCVSKTVCGFLGMHVYQNKKVSRSTHTDSRAVHFGGGGAADGGVCRFCDSGDVESLSHVLVRCSKWDPLRRSLLMVSSGRVWSCSLRYTFLLVFARRQRI